MNTFSLITSIIGLFGMAMALVFVFLSLIFKKWRPILKFSLIFLGSTFACLIVGFISYCILELDTPDMQTAHTTYNEQVEDMLQGSENNISEINSLKTENNSEEQAATSSSEIDNIENALMQLLPSSNYRYENLNVTPAYGDGYYIIQYNYMGSAWNESDLMSICLTDYIAYCKEAYKLDTVNSIKFAIFLPLQDNNGNESINHVLSIQMNKDIFNTFNWSDYENMPIYDIFISNCEEFYLAPVIGKYIEKESIIFSSYSQMFP